jgi:hypothetical protein
MQGSQYNIEMQQGSTFELFLTVNEPNGSVRDLTGYTAQMQIRSAYSSTTATETLSSTSGEIVIAPEQGKINIALSAARTAAIKVDLGGKKPPRSVYVYDLELSDAAGKTSKLLYGDVTVFGEVTR